MEILANGRVPPVPCPLPAHLARIPYPASSRRPPPPNPHRHRLTLTLTLILTPHHPQDRYVSEVAMWPSQKQRETPPRLYSSDESDHELPTPVEASGWDEQLRKLRVQLMFQKKMYEESRRHHAGPRYQNRTVEQLVADKEVSERVASRAWLL